MSGEQVMKFFWRGDQLLTHSDKIDDEDEGWTTFEMDLRKPEKVKFYL